MTFPNWISKLLELRLAYYVLYYAGIADIAFVSTLFSDRNFGIVEIQLVLQTLLAAPESHVRRSIGIVAPNTRCKLEKFRSRIDF